MAGLPLQLSWPPFAPLIGETNDVWVVSCVGGPACSAALWLAGA